MATDDATTALKDAPDMTDVEAPDDAAKRKKKDGEDLEYELEWETPFGTIELEFEPKDRKAEKDRKRREKAEREAAKAAERAARKAQRAAREAPKGGGPSRLLLVLVVLALIAAAVAVAWWLFARPGEEDADEVPPQFREGEAPPPEQRGFAARVRSAVRAGRRASREAQEEQRRRFEELTRGG